jgi:hypothetical protein
MDKKLEHTSISWQPYFEMRTDWRTDMENPEAEMAVYMHFTEGQKQVLSQRDFFPNVESLERA